MPAPRVSLVLLGLFLLYQPRPCLCLDNTYQGNCSVVDLAILLDSSGSILFEDANNWSLLLDYVHKVVKNDSYENHMALIRFSNDAEILFYLTSYSVIVDMEIAQMDSTPGDDIAAALSLVSQIFNEANGDRPEFPNIVLLITDGGSNNKSGNAAVEAQKLKQAGVDIICVGVTDRVNKTELDIIASNPNWSFLAPDWGSLLSELDRNLKSYCIDT